MKNLFRLSVLVTLALVFAVSTSVVAQKSVAYTGDKNLSNVKMSVKIISGQLDDLKDQIKNLEKTNEKKIAGLERNKKVLLRKPSENKILVQRIDTLVKECRAHTDSLTTVYEQKRSNLEDELISFTVLAAGKDQENRVELKSRNVTALADAYLTVQYAKSMSTDGATGKKLIGMVENTGFINPVIVTVTGPGNWKKEFSLKAKEKSPEFNLPYPGNYTAMFTSKYATRCITKRVGPNTVYYDGTKALDFKATLLP